MGIYYTFNTYILFISKIKYKTYDRIEFMDVIIYFYTHTHMNCSIVNYVGM